MRRLIKIMTLLVAVFSICFVMPIYAEEKPEFLEPLNGASVDSEFNRIRIRIPKSGEIHFILDGDKKFTSAGVGECFASLPEKLCMGIHTLEANILYEDGTADNTEITFKVSERGKTSELFSEDYNTYAGGVDGFNKTWCSPYKSGYVTGTPVKGAGGTDDDIAAYYEPTPECYSDNGSTNFAQINGHCVGQTSTVVFEHDLFLATGIDGVSYEFRSLTNGKFFSVLNNFFSYSGKISGTEINYPVGEWFHVTMLFDFKNHVRRIFVNENEVLTTENFEPEISDFQTWKIVPRRYLSDGITQKAGVGIDNVKVTGFNDFTGFSSVNMNHDSVKLKTDTDISLSDVTADKIKLMSNGYEMSISDVKLSGGYLEITSESGFYPGETYYIFVSDGEFTARAAASYAAEDLIFSDVNIYCGDKKILFPSQTLSGDPISAKLKIQNKSGENQSFTIVVTIRNCGKIASIKSKKFEIAPGAEDIINSEVLGSVRDTQNLEIKCMIISSWEDRTPLVSAHTVK